MAGSIAQIKDKDGNIKYPVTKMQAVYDEEGNSLDGVLEETNTAIQRVDNAALRGVDKTTPTSTVQMPLLRYDVQTLTDDQRKQAEINLTGGGYIMEQAEEAGAVWHPESIAQDGSQGAYWLNGLTDITISQMITILYEFGDFRPILGMDISKGYNYCQSRTNINLNPNIKYTDSTQFVDKAIDIGEAFEYSKNLEVLLLSNESDAVIAGNCFPIRSSAYHIFSKCYRLKKIIGYIGLSNINSLIYTFGQCNNLETVHLFNLHSDISFEWCSKLLNESILFAVQYSAVPEGQTINITLQSDAYNRAMEDTAITSILTEKRVSLVDANPA